MLNFNDFVNLNFFPISGTGFRILLESLGLAHGKQLCSQGPVNWYNAPIDLHGQPFQFPWSSENLRKTINTSLRARLKARSNYQFKFIKVPNRYWKESVGYPRARPIARGQERLDHQLQHLDFARVPQWIEVAAQIRDRNLSRRMAPLQYDPAWRQQGRMSMPGDMPLVLLDMANSVLGEESRAEWDEECLNLEVCNFEIWKQLAGSGSRLDGSPSVAPWQPPVGLRLNLPIDTRHSHRNQLSRQQWPCHWNNH